MGAFRRRGAVIALAGAAITAFALTACTGDAAPEGGTGDGDCGDYEDYGTFEAGTEVNVYGTILDPEAELLNQSWADFENCTGIDVVYEGSDQYEEQLNVRIQGGNPPDLGITPQPGLIARLAQQGDLLPAPASVADNVAQYWSDDWAAYGTVDGTLYGAPLMANIKGYIWYVPSLFEDNGWEIPETLDELSALTDEIAASGVVDKPWCVGFASGAATGWPGTDWVEDFVLRQSGPDVYDQWVAHEIPFDDPAIAEAFDAVGDFIRNDDNVNGGLGDVRSIATTDFGEAGLPVTDGTCAMHHQASFYEGFWPEGTTVAPDGDVWAFMLPGTEAGASAVTGGGEIVAAFSDDEAVVATQTYLSSPLWANNRVSLGGVVSANNGLDPENAGSELLKNAVELLQDPDTTFRFDGSDLMPAAVGSGSFWQGMVDWIGGKSTADTLEFIESSWPQ